MLTALEELGLRLDKYHKHETEECILAEVCYSPGINHYELSQCLELTPGRTRRGVARLKKRQLVRTRRIGKAICIYPILDKIGTDFTILNSA
jgi:predicted transcriptional regulator